MSPGVDGWEGGDVNRDEDVVKGVSRKFTAFGTERTRRCGFAEGDVAMVEN